MDLAREAEQWHARPTPPVGSIGYTGSYREPDSNVELARVVDVQTARGPE